MCRHSLVQPSQTKIHQSTESPPVVLYNQTAVTAEEYVGRLRVWDKKVSLHAVRMMDEGSFTVLDHSGKVRIRNCLNVKGEESSVVSISLMCMRHGSVNPGVMCI